MSDRKLTYQKPSLQALGAPAKSDGSCMAPSGYCGEGVGAVSDCSTGTTAAGYCGEGSSASLTACAEGSSATDCYTGSGGV